MISLLLSMYRARRAQAITVFLLSLVATAAAVAGPVALAAVDLAVVRNEVGAATTIERTMSVTGFVDPTSATASGSFDTVARLVDLPGFDAIRSGELEAFGPVLADADERLHTSTTRLVFRDQVCEHIVILSGRCFSGAREVVVGEDTAKRQGVRAGDVVTVQAARFNPLNGALEPDGAPATLYIAGLYRPRDPAEFYWAAQFYFPVSGDGTRREAMFVTPQTFDRVDHTIGLSSVDSLAPTSVFTLDRLASLKAEIEEITESEGAGQANFIVATSLPSLVDRIDRGQEVAHQLVPVAFIPLVGLCWFVVFLAVAHGVSGRRHELGLVALRGVRGVRRWWLAIAETTLVIVAGAPIGYLLGYLVVGLIARWRLGGADGTELSADGLPYAAIALAGALLVALLGQRRALAEPVVDLIRDVPRRDRAWRSLVIEAVAVAVAVVGVLQLRASDGGLAGIVLLVPGLVMVAVALLAARTFGPAAGVLARMALRRGRLGLGLAAVQVARRPGSQRLFALIAVASGLLVFVAAGVAVAARGRDDRAEIIVGAASVLAADRASPGQLLFATRQADPTGAWAMAVFPLPQVDEEAPPLLAVDSGRLANVAAWRPEFGPGAAAVADKLRPPKGSPLLLRANSFTVDIERTAFDEGGPPAVTRFLFESLTTGSQIVSTVQVETGRATYPADSPGCANGCRLTGIAVTTVRNDPIELRLFSVKAGDADVIAPDQLIDRARWRSADGGQVSASGDSLRIRWDPTPFLTGNVFVTVVDAPLPVPVVATRATSKNATITGLDGHPLRATLASTATLLPRLASDGALVDLEYLQRLGAVGPSAQRGEVWLGPAAPPDAVDRLRRVGLSVRESAGSAQTRAALERTGPALALQFHSAAAAFGVVLALGGLGLVAAVDRRRRAEDLSALRRQGLARRFVRRAALWGYLWLVLAAGVAGLLAAAVAWLSVGDRLPVFTDTLAELPPPRWPDPASVLGPWSVAIAATVVGAFAAAWALRRTINSSGPRNGRG